MKNVLSIALLAVLSLLSCKTDHQNPRELIIDDLPFYDAKDAKEYADLIFKAIRTNRNKAIAQEFELNDIQIDEDKLTTIVSMYSSGIGGRDDWNFYDFHALSDQEEKREGFDYAWLDPSDRLGLQMFVGVTEKEGKLYLQKIEFRSRLDIMESWSFPGGAIEDYKKIEYDWSN